MQSVRQHALSMLTDAFIDRHGRYLPDNDLCRIFKEMCIPLAGSRMQDLLQGGVDIESRADEILIEMEMCISLIFKPFLHHLKTLLKLENGELVEIWVSLLGVMTQLLGDDVQPQDGGSLGAGARTLTRDKLLWTIKELGSEHLRNAVLVLVACGVLNGEPDPSDEMSTLTWNSIGDMWLSAKST